MRLLMRLALAVAVAAGLFLAVGFLVLPRGWSVERRITVAADAATILPFLDTPAQWPVWSAWTTEKYPDMESAFEGPARGAGALWSWTGETSGVGRLTIRSSSPADGIAYDLQFDDFPPIDGTMRLEPNGEATHVVWSMRGAVGGDPISPWFALFMGSMMEEELDQGLAKLKLVAEERAGR